MRRTADYAFTLPEELIAQRPADRRDGSRLLHVAGDELVDRQFPDIVEALPGDAVLVVNDTKVIRARLLCRKETGGAVELLFLEPTVTPGHWRCLARASKPIHDGAPLLVEGSDAVCYAVGGRAEDGSLVVSVEGDVFALLESHGELPLPPYIARDSGDTPADRERYQTVYARAEGAVAAPTAGLHFTEKLLEEISRRGIEKVSVTLHVGLGTFAPVRVERLDDIELHSERYSIPKETAEAISSGRPVVAVGTTVVRALESAAAARKEVKVGAGRTNIFISPGYDFQIVDHLVTNFHLPESTLLMLVAAFAGYERIMNAYRHAVAAKYRFYSYGDAMLLERSC